MLIVYRKSLRPQVPSFIPEKNHIERAINKSATEARISFLFKMCISFYLGLNLIQLYLNLLKRKFIRR